MNLSITRFLTSVPLAMVCLTAALADEAVSQRILGRWELPSGKH